ncbi:unnamed protein product [Calicophoron daubneyi]|uniref:START domain-containing protein n=1 Tax=Calicophoron daubneyi TaxID=300641 RepID=A0AAV2TMV1_CALDB
MRFYLTSRRTVLANLALLHQSAPQIIRSIYERYCAMHIGRLTELHLVPTRRILLGGCLIAFAQDSITDEELLNNVKGLSASPSTDVSDTTEPLSAEPFEKNVSGKEEDNISPVISDPNIDSIEHVNVDRFRNPPLTLVVRQLRKELFELATHLLHPPPPNSNDEIEPSNGDSVRQPTADESLSAHFLSILKTLDFSPDGTGFVDETWDVVVNKENLRVWRRPVQYPQVANYSEQTVSSDERSCPSAVTGTPGGVVDNPSSPNYEYRLCGTLKDVSALSFLEVQLNLSYRQQWDDRVITLDYIDPPSESSGKKSSPCDVIHWVVRFPFPLAHREYTFLRRWWLEPGHPNEQPRSNCSSSDPELSESARSSEPYGRYAFVLSRACVSSLPGSVTPEGCGNEFGDSGKKQYLKSRNWTNRLKQRNVHVNTYHSGLLIESHGRFDERGMNFYLVYCDDPRLPVGSSSFSIVSGKTMIQFMDKLHAAALTLHQSGLPPGINAVVFSSERPPQESDSPPSEFPTSISSKKSPPKPPDAASTLPPKKTRFFTDSVPDNSTFSDVSY